MVGERKMRLRLSHHHASAVLQACAAMQSCCALKAWPLARLVPLLQDLHTQSPASTTRPLVPTYTHQQELSLQPHCPASAPEDSSEHAMRHDALPISSEETDAFSMGLPQPSKEAVAFTSAAAHQHMCQHAAAPPAKTKTKTPFLNLVDQVSCCNKSSAILLQHVETLT